MSNRLKMAIAQAIYQLHSLHWSQRRIARELGINRETVRKYLACGLPGAKPAISPAGCQRSKPATFSGSPGPEPSGTDYADDGQNAGAPNPAISPAGSEAVGGGSNPAIPPTGLSSPSIGAGPASAPGRPSECECFREIILAKLELDLCAQRIYQDLVADHAFKASYDSVKRFVRKLGRTQAWPMRRIEGAPGFEAQVDFGSGAPVIGPDGKRRKTHVFRIVLSHSRKGYSEATFRQTTEDFIGCIENALWHFGGVPQTLVIDNLRAAVKHPDWFDPELVPKLEAFCAHYGVAILPTRPYMPRHKGKVEAGVKYVKNNALKGRTFESLQAQNQHLAHWERTIADTRIHGTTRRQVGKVFQEVERQALRPLPRERFPFFHEAQRIVSRDGHVEVAKAYYSVPTEYLTRTVWVRWDARLVRIFNSRWEQIAIHVRHEQGRFSTQPKHVAREKINGIERGAAYLLSRVSIIGAHTRAWAEAMVTARGIEGTRVLLGLLSLTKKYESESLEKACEIALSHGAFRLRTIRQLLQRPDFKQGPLPFLEEHPIIRPLDDYARIVAAALERNGPPAAEGFLRHGSGVQWPPEKTQSPGAGVPGASSGSDGQGFEASLTRPRSGYPSSGCTSASPVSTGVPAIAGPVETTGVDNVEPDSVLPDSSILRSAPPQQQEQETDE
jgi:transposase